MAVVESKLMWMSRDGHINYIAKADFDKVVNVANKVVDRAIIAGVVTALVSNSNVVFATEVANVAAETAKDTNSIMTGLAPLIKLIGDIAEPVTYGYMVKGFLKFTQGREEEAKKTLINAGTGFLGCKFTPQVIDFLGNIKLFA